MRRITVHGRALALLLPLTLTSAAGPTHSPSQFFYDEEARNTVQQVGGCSVSRWDGTDADGVTGYPWLTNIDCSKGATFEDAGVNFQGHVRFYLRSGSLSVNEHNLRLMGSAVWANQGAFLNVSLSAGGAVYIVGAPYRLRGGEGVHFSTSYLAPRVRAYLVEDAVANRSHARNGHDPHINNGTTNARDLLWSSNSSVDPPSIVVLNCAPSDPSYVWYHSHPQGAVYLPFAGKICFQTDALRCILPGAPRWTSPLLYYYETFHATPESVPGADEVVGMVGMEDCPRPIVFAVTNFDPDQTAGQPNFDDVPKNGQLGEKWGVFGTMTVRTTTVLSRTVTYDGHGDTL